jgi:DNA-binding transcriptional LysR family regulator
VRLTDAGEVLAGYARRIFSLASEAETALADLSSLRRGRLALGASPTIGVYLLPPVLVHFRRRFPGVDLRLEIENADVLRRRLEEGSVELGLTEVAVESPDLESTAFMTDEFVAIGPPGHPLARKRSVSPAAFCREPFVVRQSPSPAGSLVERSMAAAGLAVQPVLSLSSTEAVKQAVAAGLGVAWVSKLTAGPDLAAGRVVEIKVTGLAIRRPLYQLRPGGRRQSKALVAFLCLLKHGVRGTLPVLPGKPPLPLRGSAIKPPAARAQRRVRAL